jgi:hypothetical protein
MGVGKSKDEKQKPRVVKPQKQTQTKRVRLLVLHNNSQQPQPGTGRFCDALNSEGNIMVDGDVKIFEIPDNGQLPESVKNEITSWMSRGRIVLVCLLTDYDVHANFGNDNRIIVFCFSNPAVCNPPRTCFGVDFYTALPENIKDDITWDELVSTIHDMGQ